MGKPCRNNGSQTVIIAIFLFTFGRLSEVWVGAFSLLCQLDVFVLPALWCVTVIPCVCNHGSLDGLRKDGEVVEQVPAVVCLSLTGAPFCSALVRGNDIDRLSMAANTVSLPSFSRSVETHWRFGQRGPPTPKKRNKTCRCQRLNMIKRG